jgi:hypothetical protein
VKAVESGECPFPDQKIALLLVLVLVLILDPFSWFVERQLRGA